MKTTKRIVFVVVFLMLLAFSACSPYPCNCKEEQEPAQKDVKSAIGKITTWLDNLGSVKADTAKTSEDMTSSFANTKDKVSSAKAVVEEMPDETTQPDEASSDVDVDMVRKKAERIISMTNTDFDQQWKTIADDRNKNISRAVALDKQARKELAKASAIAKTIKSNADRKEAEAKIDAAKAEWEANMDVIRQQINGMNSLYAKGDTLRKKLMIAAILSKINSNKLDKIVAIQSKNEQLINSLDSVIEEVDNILKD